MAWPALFSGEPVTIRIPNVRDADTDLPLDLDAATEIEWQLRQRIRLPGETDLSTDNPVLISKSLAAGVTVDGADILIAIDADDTVELLPDRYMADCWVTIAGKRRLAVAPDRLEVKGVVNPP